MRIYGVILLVLAIAAGWFAVAIFNWVPWAELWEHFKLYVGVFLLIVSAIATAACTLGGLYMVITGKSPK